MRIGDQRVLRLIRKWLNAGVIDAGLEVDVVAGDAAEGGDIAAAGERVPAPRAGPLVRAGMAAAGGPGRGVSREVRR